MNPALPRSNSINGLVIRVLTFAPSFWKIILSNNGTLIYLILKNKHKKPPVGSGDLILAHGRYKLFEGKLEFEADGIVVEHCDKAHKVRKGLGIQVRCRKLQLYAIRSHASRFINAHLTDRRFLPVQSPTITSAWVEGRTVPFSIKFYEQNAYLSISNMLYHQMMISNGMSDIFEIGKLHRQELGSGKNKLSEFTIVDISRAFASIEDLMDCFEEVLIDTIKRLRGIGLYEVDLLPEIRFDRIDCAHLIEKSGTHEFAGSQLPRACKEFLQKTFSSFVWVTGFDLSKRPFYSRSRGGVSADAQLWYRGKGFFAAGTEVEEDIEKIIHNIKSSGKNILRYRPYLLELQKGYPPMAMIGMGLELFLSHLVMDSATAEFTWFPRYEAMSYF